MPETVQTPPEPDVPDKSAIPAKPTLPSTPSNSPATNVATVPDPALQALLAPLDPPVAVRLRTLANAWQAGGGALLVGRVAIRLLAPGSDGRPFTAGTIHPGHDAVAPRLELARVLLQNHGVGEQAWSDWCDERPELRSLGFSRTVKFPAVTLDAIPDAVLARLALGLRDLARMVRPKA